MEDISVLKRPVTTTNRKGRINLNKTKISSEARKNNLVPGKLSGEVDENFINYLNWHGLANEDNLLVLSSKMHYY